MEVRIESIPSRVVSAEGSKQTLTMGISAPGLLAWAKSGYAGGKSGKAVVEAFAGSFGISQAMALALITGEIEYRVEGDDVVFEWFDDRAAESTQCDK
jgi:hypothetical protein